MWHHPELKSCPNGGWHQWLLNSGLAVSNPCLFFPFVIGRTPGRQLRKTSRARLWSPSKVTELSQEAFTASFLFGQSCFLKRFSSQALLCPSASRWTRCYWAILQDDYSTAGINPQEGEGGSVWVWKQASPHVLNEALKHLWTDGESKMEFEENSTFPPLSTSIPGLSSCWDLQDASQPSDTW